MKEQQNCGIAAVQARTEAYWAHFPAHWQRMAEAWQRGEDGAWLIAHASYVLNTGFLWAVDPALRIGNAEEWLRPRAPKTLRDLRFVLLTHLHADHYSLPLLQALRPTGAQVVVPEFFPPELEAQLAPLSVVRVRPGNAVFINGARINVLPGAHYDFNAPENGVPAVGYSVAVQGKMLVFPGDIRDYARSAPPAGDMLFAHVWLGRGCGEKPPAETCLEAFAAWLRRAAPRRAVLTHLHDTLRELSDRWTDTHTGWIYEALQGSGIELCAPAPGERLLL